MLRPISVTTQSNTLTNNSMNTLKFKTRLEEYKYVNPARTSTSWEDTGEDTLVNSENQQAGERFAGEVREAAVDDESYELVTRNHNRSPTSP